jgi:hypothetical protein
VGMNDHGGPQACAGLAQKHVGLEPTADRSDV